MSTTITWPSNVIPAAADYGMEFDVQKFPLRSGKIDRHGFPGGRWTATITLPPDYDPGRAKIEAVVMALRGGARLLRMPHFGRPVPRGTMRGSPTLAQSTTRGADTVTITATGTLLAGDIIGLGDYFFMVGADATASAGAITVAVSPSVPKAFSSGTQVKWDKPTTLWVPRESVAGPFPFLPVVRPSFSIDLIQAVE